MHLKQFSRLFSTTRFIGAAEKSPLGTLRKQTGYSFSNCKKALELNSNDVAKAEQWLKQQAQTMGWAKAQKLEGRNTKQGLVGVLVQNNIAAMVEVNCETDFVARNNQFQQFVDTVLKACLNHVSSMPTNNNGLSKIDFATESLKQMKFNDKSLGDHLALMIGTVGENAALRRAACFKAQNALTLTGFAHPATSQLFNENESQLGRFGTIVALKSETSPSLELRKNVCQHIVGMNPKKIGIKDTDQPCETKDDEDCLIFQEYLLDPTITVDELLNENDVKVIDFQRFECGEQIQLQQINDEKSNISVEASN